MHAPELDFLVGYTPQSQTTFVFLYLLHLSTTFYKKTEVKKISWTICDFCYYFHINIFRHHREITIIKFRIKTDTWEVTDSAVCIIPQSQTIWCTRWSETPWWDAHLWVFWDIFPRSLTPCYEYLGEIKKKIRKCFSQMGQMGSNHEKLEVKNLVTHSL